MAFDYEMIEEGFYDEESYLKYLLAEGEKKQKETLCNIIAVIKEEWDYKYPHDKMVWSKFGGESFSSYKDAEYWYQWMIIRKEFRRWQNENKKLWTQIKSAYHNLRKYGNSTHKDYKNFTKKIVDETLRDVAHLYIIPQKDRLKDRINELNKWKNENSDILQNSMISPSYSLLKTDKFIKRIKLSKEQLENYLIENDSRYHISQLEAWLIISYEDYMLWRKHWVDNLDINALQEEHPVANYDNYRCHYEHGAEEIECTDLYSVLKDRWLAAHKKYVSRREDLFTNSSIIKFAENEYWNRYLYIPLLALLKKQINDLTKKKEESEKEQLLNKMFGRELDQSFFYDEITGDVDLNIGKQESDEIKQECDDVDDCEDLLLNDWSSFMDRTPSWKDRCKLMDVLWEYNTCYSKSTKNYLKTMEDLCATQVRQRILLEKEFKVLKTYDEYAENVYESLDDWIKENSSSSFVEKGGSYCIGESRDDVKLPCWEDFSKEYIEDIIVKEWCKRHKKEWLLWADKELHIYYLKKHFCIEHEIKNNSYSVSIKEYHVYGSDDLPKEELLNIWKKTHPDLYKEILNDIPQKIELLQELYFFAKRQFKGIKGVDWLYKHRNTDIYKQWMQRVNQYTDYFTAHFYFDFNWPDKLDYDDDSARHEFEEFINNFFSKYRYRSEDRLFANIHKANKKRHDTGIERVWMKEYSFLIDLYDWLNYIVDRDSWVDVYYNLSEQLDSYGSLKRDFLESLTK